MKQKVYGFMQIEALAAAVVLAVVMAGVWRILNLRFHRLHRDSSGIEAQLFLIKKLGEARNTNSGGTIAEEDADLSVGSGRVVVTKSFIADDSELALFKKQITILKGSLSLKINNGLETFELLSFVSTPQADNGFKNETSEKE